MCVGTNTQILIFIDFLGNGREGITFANCDCHHFFGICPYLESLPCCKCHLFGNKLRRCGQLFDCKIIGSLVG